MKKSELIWALCEVDEDLILMAKEDSGMNTGKKKHGTKLLRMGICAAVIVGLFAASVFAAYEYNLFGFRDLFGEESTMIEDYVVVLDPEAENADSEIVAEERAYTDWEQSYIDAGMMAPQEQAKLTGEGVQAITENYRYTLEEMVATEDTFMAILKVEALNEAAKPRMEQALEKGADEFFTVFAINQAGTDGHNREAMNGGLGCDLLNIDDGVGYYLVSNSGGQFAVGDRILLEDLWDSIGLFEVPITKLMDTAITMDVEAEGFTSISITPLSMELGGNNGRVEYKEASITLKDGTVIELAAIGNNFAYLDYGTYGTLSVSGTIDPEKGYGVFTWTFSRLIDPEQVEKVTINGTDYYIE